MLEIFCRIPINTIIQCKYVCKSWRRSLSDPEFTNSLFVRTPAWFLFQDLSTQSLSQKTKRRRGMPPNKHILANLESVSRPNSMVLKLSDPNALYNKLQYSTVTGITGSCNGFLCLSRYNKKLDASIFNLSNPITRECIPLPVNEETGTVFHSGFGFSPMSDVYKVVVFASNRKQKRRRRDLKVPKLEVMVLTVGSGNWRRIGEIPDSVDTSEAVLLDGFLHWICRCKRGCSHLIRAFDVESERFKDLAMPPLYFGMGYRPQMRVLEGSLCINDGFTFWVMKEYGGVKASWTKVLEIGDDTIRPISEYTARGVEVLKFMEGKVLLLVDDKLWLYTLVTRTLERVEIDGMPSGYLRFEQDHIPSFVSVKDVMKE